MKSFVALITVLGDAAGGGGGTGIWGGANEPFPTPPIVIPPDRPPGIWGGPIDPYPDQGLPGRPPHIWGGGNEPFPTPPIVIPPPNFTPPPDVKPPQAGEPPVGIGGAQPVHPIVTPPFILVRYPGYGWIAVAPPAQPPPTTPPGTEPPHVEHRGGIGKK